MSPKGPKQVQGSLDSGSGSSGDKTEAGASRGEPARVEAYRFSIMFQPASNMAAEHYVLIHADTGSMQKCIRAKVIPVLHQASAIC